jgi:hypothetical protein
VLGATVIPRGGGGVIGDAPHRRVEVVCEQDALHATWVRLAAGGEGADLHVHRRHSDLFYVLDGELTVRLGRRASRSRRRPGRWRASRRSSCTATATRATRTSGS